MAVIRGTSIRIPSFLDGLARTFDIGDQFDQWHLSEDPWQADADAIGEDWAAVGQDLIDAAKSDR